VNFTGEAISLNLYGKEDGGGFLIAEEKGRYVRSVFRGFGRRMRWEKKCRDEREGGGGGEGMVLYLCVYRG